MPTINEQIKIPYRFSPIQLLTSCLSLSLPFINLLFCACVLSYSSPGFIVMTTCRCQRRGMVRLRIFLALLLSYQLVLASTTGNSSQSGKRSNCPMSVCFITSDKDRKLGWLRDVSPSQGLLQSAIWSTSVGTGLVLQIANWRSPWEGETSLNHPNFPSLSDVLNKFFHLLNWFLPCLSAFLAFL